MKMIAELWISIYFITSTHWLFDYIIGTTQILWIFFLPFPSTLVFSSSNGTKGKRCARRYGIISTYGIGRLIKYKIIQKTA